jgi:hypothetical protein
MKLFKNKNILLTVFTWSLCVVSIQALEKGVVVSASGPVNIKTESQPFAMASAGTEIQVGTTIQTGDQGEVTLALFNGLAVTLKEGTSATVLQLEPIAEGQEGISKALLEIRAGRMVVLISEEKKSVVDFRIKTPKGIAQPRGTFYAIQVQDGDAFLAVKEGKVGLDQFTPLEYEQAAVPEGPTASQDRQYGQSTTTSPRG